MRSLIAIGEELVGLGEVLKLNIPMRTGEGLFSRIDVADRLRLLADELAAFHQAMRSPDRIVASRQSCATLKVEVTPGSNIRTACIDLCVLAARVGCVVESTFNNVVVWARAGDDPLKLEEAYYAVLGTRAFIKIAQCQ